MGEGDRTRFLKIHLENTSLHEIILKELRTAKLRREGKYSRSLVTQTNSTVLSHFWFLCWETGEFQTFKSLNNLALSAIDIPVR